MVGCVSTPRPQRRVVDVVDAVVAHVAGAEVIPPVSSDCGRGWCDRESSAPGRPSCRSRSPAGGSAVLPAADRAAALDVPALGDQHVADDAFAQQLHGLDHHRRAAALRAVLHERLVALRGLDQQPAFANVVRDRLLDVDVLAGVAGQDRRRANANGRAWRRSPHRPTCRRGSCRMSATARLESTPSVLAAACRRPSSTSQT